MCLPLEVESSIGGVLSNLVLLTLAWRTGTLQLQKQHREWYGSRISRWIWEWYLQRSRLLHFIVTIAERLQTRMNLGATREKSIERKYNLIREIVSRGDAVVSQIV